MHSPRQNLACSALQEGAEKTGKEARKWDAQNLEKKEEAAGKKLLKKSVHVFGLVHLLDFSYYRGVCNIKGDKILIWTSSDCS